MKTNLRSAIILLFFIWNFLSIYAQPTDNIVAYYPFSGNANDVSSNGKNATVSNATLTSDRFGNPNSAYFFNGSNSLIYLPNYLLPGNNAYAISCWISIRGDNSTNDGQTIIDLRGQFNTCISYYQPNSCAYPNSVIFYAASPSFSYFFATPGNLIQTNKWYHIVASYGNNIMQLYVNGNLIGSIIQSPPSVVTGYYNTIGKDYNVGLNRYWFYGAIDDIIIYKRSLTQSEVQSMYDKQLVTSDIPKLYTTVEPYISGEKDIVIHPNPTQEKLTIDLQGVSDNSKAEVSLYSLNGDLLSTQTSYSSTTSLNMSGFPNGTYLVKVKLGNKIFEKKIIKQ